MTVKDPGRIPVGLFRGERLSDDAVRRLSVGASRIVAFADGADAATVQAQWSQVAPEIEVEVVPGVAGVREAIIECAKRKVMWLAAPEPRNATRFVAGALQGAAAATEFEIPSVAVHVLRDQGIPGPVAWLSQTGAMSGYGVLYALAIAAMTGRSVIISRSLRLLFGKVAHWLGRRLPRRLAWVLGVSALLLLFWLVITGVLVKGFFAGANAMFSVRDTDTPPTVSQPVEPERSGSTTSLAGWDTLGRQGRIFTGWGPRAEQINSFSGGGAKEPIRAYVGLKTAGTLQERADLLLAELQRSGAFDRKALVVATTTGTGFLDPNGVDPLEYLLNGDTAIAGVQYSYLPSWISLLADQEAVKETSRTVFDTVHRYWSTLPEESRPKLYLYGLSLGSFGVESILSSISIVNEPIDGALMSGPPFVNALHDDLEANRQPGTPPWQPIYGDGRTVRFTAEQNGFGNTPGPWGPSRLVYLQHNSDPVVFFSPRLALEAPEWLIPGQKGPDISETMGWFPLVTMWQVALDLPGAGNVPEGFGHLYTYRANLESWIEITQEQGWTPARIDQLVSILEAQPRYDAAADSSS